MKYVLFVFLLIIVAKDLPAQDIAPKKDDDQNNYQQLYLGVGYPFIVNSQDFFNDFQDYLGAGKNTFSASNLYQLKYKLKPLYVFRLGLEINYFNLQLNDAYSTEFTIANAKYNRNLTQEVKVKNIPAYLTLDYVPYYMPYKSYFGLGLGVCYSQIKWNEYSESKYKYDYYKPGEHLNKSEVLPCFKLYTGVELSFDETLDFTFLGSLCFELSYTFYTGSTNFFENTAQQNYTSPVDLSKEYRLFPSSLDLSMLVSFNMSDKIFLRNKPE